MKKTLVILPAIILFCSYTADAPQQKQPEYKLKLNESELQIVLGGLSKLPYEQSAGVIQKIVAQAQDSTFQKK